MLFAQLDSWGTNKKRKETFGEHFRELFEANCSRAQIDWSLDSCARGSSCWLQRQAQSSGPVKRTSLDDGTCEIMQASAKDVKVRWVDVVPSLQSTENMYLEDEG